MYNNNKAASTYCSEIWWKILIARQDLPKDLPLGRRVLLPEIWVGCIPQQATAEEKAQTTATWIKTWMQMHIYTHTNTLGPSKFTSPRADKDILKPASCSFQIEFRINFEFVSRWCPTWLVLSSDDSFVIGFSYRLLKYTELLHRCKNKQIYCWVSLRGILSGSDVNSISTHRNLCCMNKGTHLDVTIIIIYIKGRDSVHTRVI